MTSRDIHWGRGGGRQVDPGRVLDGETFPAVCLCGSWTAVAANLKKCDRCGAQVVRVKPEALR